MSSAGDPSKNQQRDPAFFKQVILPAVREGDGLLLIPRSVDQSLAWAECTAWGLLSPEPYLEELVARKKLTTGLLPPSVLPESPKKTQEDLAELDPSCLRRAANNVIDLLLGHVSQRSDADASKPIRVAGSASPPALVSSPFHSHLDFSFFVSGRGGAYLHTAAVLRGLQMKIVKKEGGEAGLSWMKRSVVVDATGTIPREQRTPLLYGNLPGVFEGLQPVRVVIRRPAPREHQTVEVAEAVRVAGVEFTVKVWANELGSGVIITRADGEALGKALVPYLIAPVVLLATEAEAEAFREGSMAVAGNGDYKLAISEYHSIKEAAGAFPLVGVQFQPLAAFPAIGFDRVSENQRNQPTKITYEISLYKASPVDLHV